MKLIQVRQIQIKYIYLTQTLTFKLDRSRVRTGLLYQSTFARDVGALKERLNAEMLRASGAFGRDPSH